MHDPGKWPDHRQAGVPPAKIWPESYSTAIATFPSMIAWNVARS